jgi:hypothetical protein
VVKTYFFWLYSPLFSLKFIYFCISLFDGLVIGALAFSHLLVHLMAFQGFQDSRNFIYQASIGSQFSLIYSSYSDAS